MNKPKDNGGAEGAARGMRTIITLVGRRNAGKSSLINALCNQEVAIVSDIAGTTTDPVAKAYELLPLGPVTFYDTAGIDDEGEIGKLRVSATKKVLCRTDIALMVINERGIKKEEEDLVNELKKLDIPFIIVFNKCDLTSPSQSDIKFCQSNAINFAEVSAKNYANIDDLKAKIIATLPKDMMAEPSLAADLIKEGDFVLCITPIDLAAPKGRLILPQVQLIREILDSDAIAVVSKEREIEAALSNFGRKPNLVVTDSQVVLKVAGDVPDDIPLTTFSILFARFKGDLKLLVDGARAIDKLQNGDKVLIGEACSHHNQADDIGRVKIPRWLTQYTGKDLHFDIFSGHDFPENLEDYKLVIHCGACMINRKEMVRRIVECNRRGVPITNYGVCISKVQGVLERVIKPFIGI
ncbi:MAG: [FeFe] hydrogenase H-cluster maturation GTPase HydF [Alphaproteobacteria bacterium]